MTVFVCLDDHNGMLFNGRRQSMDSRLREQILDICAGRPLWMNSYSAGQFSAGIQNIRVAEDFLENGQAGAYCFVENMDISPAIELIERIVVFRWNHRYPADVYFPIEQFANRWELVSSKDFEGSSHPIITQEVYKL